MTVLWERHQLTVAKTRNGVLKMAKKRTEEDTLSDRITARAEAIEPHVLPNVFVILARAGLGDIASEVAIRECGFCGCSAAFDPNGYWRHSVVGAVAALSIALDDGVVPEYGVGHLVILWFGTLRKEHLDLALSRGGRAMDDLGAAFAFICIGELENLGYPVVPHGASELLVLPRQVA